MYIYIQYTVYAFIYFFMQFFFFLCHFVALSHWMHFCRDRIIYDYLWLTAKSFLSIFIMLFNAKDEHNANDRF